MIFGTVPFEGINFATKWDNSDRIHPRGHSTKLR